jgi:predicted ABC-class ATPase
VEDQGSLRDQLKSLGLVAFVRNGSILPRVSGADPRPMPGGLPFTSPPSMEVSLQMINAETTVKGMGVREGVTLIVGGGFHGKSTLLQAIQEGVYDKVIGDGREGVVTRDDAVKVKAEDGRKVAGVDIER